MATCLALFDDSSTTWRLEPSALTPGLQGTWTNTITDPATLNEARGFTWSFQTSSGPVETYLHTDGTCLYIDAALADAAEIACLFRQYVPGSIEVIFCDQGYNFDLVITRDTTPAELIRRVDALSWSSPDAHPSDTESERNTAASSDGAPRQLERRNGRPRGGRRMRTTRASPPRWSR
ncbi:hypothetical protein [Streptomyces sp. NPDC085540]|uniref:hypothetical protein n=1 Tax=Streptomyces sp. NPDC085540 TaxID=3365730 RepID=UPI0037D559D2